MPNAFKDTEGRTWQVAITVADVKRVRSLLDIDLYKLLDDGFKGLGELVADPVALVDLVYVLCRPEADRRGVSDEDFGRAMAGDCIEDAVDAFLGALTDFFPNPRVRQSLTSLLAKGRRVRDLVMDRATEQIGAIDVDSEAARWIASSGSSPASSASTPAPSPSASST